MKSKCFYSFILAILFSFPVLAEKFSGFVSIEKSQVYLVMNNNGANYSRLVIRPYSQEAKENLSKLHDRDYISGVGNFTSDKTLLVESIDFVGLRQLLGVWVGDNTWINFRDFTTANMYSQNPEAPQKTELEYSVTSAPGADWTIFFAGENTVNVASLSLGKQRAVLQFFDAETGQMTKKVELTKLSSYR